MDNMFAAVVEQLRSGDVVLALVLVLFGFWSVYRAAVLGRVLRKNRIAERCAQVASQIGLALLLEQAYEFTRGQIPHRTDIALTNAYRLLDIEWRHGFFVESRIERFFLQFGYVMNAVDLFYVLCHVVVTIGALAWVYLRRKEHYPFMRNMLVVTTAIALVSFYVYPTAPPRFLSQYGFVDPLQLHHLVSDGGSQAGSYTYNPYAAMPSLHVAYALVVGWTLFLCERRLWIRICACAYPLLMGAAVIISGNHWLLDVAGAYVTVLLAAGSVWMAGRAWGWLNSEMHRGAHQPR